MDLPISTKNGLQMSTIPIRLEFKIEKLVNNMLDNIPTYIWESSTTTFLDPCMAGGQFCYEIERRLRSYGHSEENIAGRVFGWEANEQIIRFAVNSKRLIGKYSVVNVLNLEYNYKIMKFDVIIGNPPYNEASESENFNTKQKGSANFWIEFFKFAKLHLRDNGVIAFITPNHWFRKSNRISKVFKSGQFIWAEIGQDVSKMFGVGSTITAWIWSPKAGDHNVLLDGVKINDIFDRLQPLTKGATFDDWLFLNEISNNGRTPVEWTRALNCSEMSTPCVIVERASPMKGSYIWNGVSRPKGDWYYYNGTASTVNNIIHFLKGDDGQRMLNLVRSGPAMTHVINSLPVLESTVK